GQVLAADRKQEGNGDGVVDVGDAVDAWQARLQAAQQSLDAGPGPLRLGSEAAEGLPPLGNLRQVLGPRASRCLAARCSAAARLASSPGPGRRPWAVISSAA